MQALSAFAPVSATCYTTTVADDLDELTRVALEDRLLDLHTSLLGKVTAVYPDGTADVQPLTRRPVPSTDGGLQYERIPEIPRALLLAFGTPRSSISSTIQSGDTVWVLCPEADISQALESGTEVEPASVARHSLACALAIPVCLPGRANVSDYAVLASRTMTALQNITTWLTTHTHVCAAPGEPSLAAALPPPTIPDVSSAGMQLK